MRYSRVSHLLTQSLSDVERVVFLHKEIEDYVDHIVSLTSVRSVSVLSLAWWSSFTPSSTHTHTHTQHRRVYQELMISKIRAIVAKLWSNSLVECYGSYATSLCIPSSDLDLVVLLSAASTLLCGYKSVETNKYRKAPIPAAMAFGCPDH